MAGKSFQVTVSAPKAPCRQTQTSVAAGHQALSAAWSPSRRADDGAALACWRCRARTTQVATASTVISAPTPVAR